MQWATNDITTAASNPTAHEVL